MIRVVVCDSGISEQQNKYCTPIDIGYGVLDDNGHGTLIMETIHKIIGDNVRLFSIKILDSHRATTLDVLINSLFFCATQRFDIICLPLSVLKCEENSDLRNAINKLSESNAILISPLANNARRSIPAIYQNVIGTKFDVGNTNSDTDAFYFPNEEIQAILPMKTALFKKNNVYDILGGNSLSCALFTTHVIDTMIEKGNSLSLIELNKIFAQQTIHHLKFMRCYSETSNKKIDDIALSQAKATLQSINKQWNVDDTKPFYESFSSMDDFSLYLNSFDNTKYKINRRTILSVFDCSTVEKFATYLCHQMDTQ